jgi:hypothetical protein
MGKGTLRDVRGPQTQKRQLMNPLEQEVDGEGYYYNFTLTQKAGLKNKAFIVFLCFVCLPLLCDYIPLFPEASLPPLPSPSLPILTAPISLCLPEDLFPNP